MCIRLVYWVYLAVFQSTWAINVWTMENVKFFMVTGESAASESPFEISRDDITIETRITNFSVDRPCTLAQTEVRETCRALHLATKDIRSDAREMVPQALQRTTHLKNPSL